MSLILVGLNHESAPLAVREKAALSPEQVALTLKGLRDRERISQALLLSTCNRTELYAVVGDAGVSLPQVRDTVFTSRIPELNGGADSFLYEHLDTEAVRHLFRVTCGLESLVLGEQEILGQVKNAFEISRSAESVGTVLHRLADHAFKVGKRARSETRIGYGPVSVAYAAVELAEKVFQTLEGRGVLLVGAGENGVLCAEHLISRGVEPLLVANRTLERAETVARDLGGEAFSLDGMEEAMARVDIVVTTTGASGAIIDEEMVRKVMHMRESRALVFIDIAVPRDVDPEVDRVPNIFRFDMDSLKSIVDQSITRRRKEVPAVERLIDAEVAGFMRWWESLASGPVIRDLNRVFEGVRAHEVERNAKRFQSEDREQLDIFTRNLIRKLLAGTAQRLKHYRAGNPEEMERLAALREAFGLDEGKDEDDADA